MKSTDEGSHVSRPKVLFLGSLAILALLLAAGCPLALKKAGFIRLQIDPTGSSKGIAVADFEVTGLRIRVQDAVGGIMETIDWGAMEGSRSYLILVKQAGECEIEVTHIGEQKGEAVQAFESEVFEVQAMRITVIHIVPGCIGLIRVEGGTQI
jgi:hypothetical protein